MFAKYNNSGESYLEKINFARLHFVGEINVFPDESRAFISRVCIYVQYDWYGNIISSHIVCVYIFDMHHNNRLSTDSIALCHLRRKVIDAAAVPVCYHSLKFEHSPPGIYMYACIIWLVRSDAFICWFSGRTPALVLVHSCVMCCWGFDGAGCLSVLACDVWGSREATQWGNSEISFNDVGHQPTIRNPQRIIIHIIEWMK